MNTRNVPFSLLIKPASADCNLRCEYCFYLDRCRIYPDSNIHRISDDTLERLISSYMATQQPQYIFGWQGGEPTLMGVDFFCRVVELQQKYGRPGAEVANGLQTNATLITDEMAELFVEYNFLLGVSLDGPEEIHNKYRRIKGGGGTHADVMNSIECLKKHNVEFNILTLVSAANVGRVGDVYSYLVDNGLYFQQYIPCVELGKNGDLLPFSITGAQWGQFLCGIFDLWKRNDRRRVSVRFFDDVLRVVLDDKRDICRLGNDCRRYFVVEHNGDVYPCDFFVYPELKLGNIADDAWESLWDSTLFIDFGKRKNEWNSDCNDCEWCAICNGDCLKHRMPGGCGDPRRLSCLCEGWKMFFDHAMPTFKEIADKIRRERRRITSEQEKTHAAVPGRNDLCPCGSGKKYKKCCIRK